MLRRCYALLGALLVACAGCTAPVYKSSSLLVPQHWDLETRPTVVFVDQSSDLVRKISAGDELVAVGEKPVDSFIQLFALTSRPEVYQSEATIRRPDGSLVQISMEDLFYGLDGASPVQWVEFGATDNVTAYQNIDGKIQTFGAISAGKIAGVFGLTSWDTLPRIVEVTVAVQAEQDCVGCAIQGIWLVDIAKQSYLEPVPSDHAALAILPDMGSPEQMVEVPPPTPIGATTTSSTFGSFNAHGAGNSVIGTYSGATSTNVTQQYDYSAQNAAAFHNLGVQVRNERIANQNSARDAFLGNRYGNLRLGPLGAGEFLQGHVFFALPNGFDGPFAVQFANRTGEVGWLRFNPAAETAK